MIFFRMDMMDELAQFVKALNFFNAKWHSETDAHGIRIYID